MSASTRFWTINEPPVVRGVRTFNSSLLPPSTRVLQPEQQEEVTRPRHRSESPTFRSTATPDADTARRGGLRTVIQEFTPQQRPLRPVTPTRRYPMPGGAPSSIFTDNAKAVASTAESVSRLRSANRRAATPEPPQRGFNQLSLFDSPAMVTPLAKKRLPPPTDPNDGLFRRCMSIERSGDRNRSSIVFS
jgi:hypothetical protein